MQEKGGDVYIETLQGEEYSSLEKQFEQSFWKRDMPYSKLKEAQYGWTIEDEGESDTWRSYREAAKARCYRVLRSMLRPWT